MKAIVAFAAIVATATADVKFSRTVTALAAGNAIDLLLSPGCASTDKYGSNDCDFKWGQNITGSITGTLAQDLDATVKLNVNVKVDGIIPLQFGCQICGANCTFTVPVVKQTVNFAMPPCPIAKGDLNQAIAAALPAKSPVPLDVKVKGTVSITSSSGTLASLDITAELSPSGRTLAIGNLDTYTFEQYIMDFLKTYPASELPSRKAIFAAHMDEVKKHNSNPDATWKMGVNKFSDMTAGERAAFKGRRKEALQHIPLLQATPEWRASLRPVKDLPESVDWRTKGVVTPVKDQGGCGSCWAFSAVEVLESNVAINTGKLLDLSTQQLVSCAPNPDECGGTGGCSGSVQWLAFNYTKSAGLSLESDYPYTGVTGKCQPAKIKPAINIDGYVRLQTNNYTELMNAIATVGPIAISIAADDIMFYSSGIFSRNCGWTIDHAVVLVGYGPGYYLVRNSWGASWGEDGYIRIARSDDDENNCGTDTSPSSGTACKPYPSQMKVCGLCGILSDSSYATGGRLA